MGWLLAASRTSTLVHFCRTPARHITSLGDKSHNSCVFGAAYVCGGQFLNVSYQATLPEQPRRGVQFNRNVEVCMCVCVVITSFPESFYIAVTIERKIPHC